MKIFYSSYKLQLKAAANRQSQKKLSGFLLKIQTDDFEAGYADCLPWKMFGDDSVKDQLQRLRTGRLNELLVRSLYYATIDGHARANKVSLFDDVQVKSHFTSTELVQITPAMLTRIAERGFETIKLKLGINPIKEAKTLSALPRELYSLFRWRLDFNGAGGAEFLANCDEDFLCHVEFIEDPSRYNLAAWKRLEKRFGVAIAFDQPQGAFRAPAYAGTRIIKPARGPAAVRPVDIITNSMDHPVGQSFAFWEAQRCISFWGKQPREYGLKTNHLIKPFNFSREIFDDSPYFSYSDGYGVGFNKLLERQKWQTL